MSQFGIAIFGVLAIWLSQSASEWQRKWACIAGCCAQPFWIYTALSAQQWGILALTFLYSASWLKGVWVNWVQPWRDSRRAWG